MNGEIGEIEAKIAALDTVREGLRRGLLGLREEELELEDERAFFPSRIAGLGTDLSLCSVEGIRERIGIQEERKKGRAVSASSRRRKGPAFLPSEHDELPSGVAFMVRSLLREPSRKLTTPPRRLSLATSLPSLLSTFPNLTASLSPPVSTNRSDFGT